MSARPPFRILATRDAGPVTNQVALVDNAYGKFAYLTVGAEEVAYLRLSASDGGGSAASATDSVTVNALGALDLLQVAVSGPKPRQTYSL